MIADMSRAGRVLLMLLAFCGSAHSQNNEFTLMRGAGRFYRGGMSEKSGTGSLTYSRMVTRTVAIEGGLDWFFLRGDGFSGFHVSAVYHFLSPIAPRQVIPFASVGIGNTSTDFTEIPMRTVYRVNAGMKYYVWPAVGIRVQLDDRIVHSVRDAYFAGAANWAQLPSFSVGVSLRH